MYRKVKVCRVEKQGFSLIEMMIALSVLTFGLLAVGQLLYVAAGSNSLARSKATAAMAAQNILESLGDLYRQNPSAADFTPGNHGPRNFEVANPADGTVLNRYQVSWAVENITDPRPGKALNARLVRATVTPALNLVTENPQIGFNKTLNVTTLFSQGVR